MILINISFGACEESNTGNRWSDIKFKETGILLGWGTEALETDDYETIPLSFQFKFSLPPHLQLISPPRITELEIEPFLSLITSPETNAELGFTLVVKLLFPANIRNATYLEVGSGICYSSQEMIEQSTQVNFISLVGMGIEHRIGENLSLSFGYRFRHFSNAGLGSRNRGVNNHIITAGLSFLRF